MVTHRNMDVKVLQGRSSNPASSHLFFWQMKVIYSHRYITLDSQLEANNWRGFKSEIHDFFFIDELMSHRSGSCRSTEKISYKGQKIKIQANLKNKK